MGRAVKKKVAAEVVPFDQSIFEQDAGAGVSDLGQEDLALPFLKLISGLDTLLDDPDFKGRKGDIYNTVSETVHTGGEGVKVIPCVYQRRFIQWAPRGAGTGAPLAIFEPTDELPKTERSREDNREYVVGGDGSYLEETHQHFVVVLNEDGSAETAMIAMKSTGLKKSRKWNSMMSSITMKGKNGPFTPPRFSSVYLLKSVQEENSKGKWHNWDMSRVGPVEDAALYQRAREFAISIRSGEVVVKHSNEEADMPTPHKDEVPF
ncbi:MAG: hypothetical protein CMC70_01400 [Flavobacteriaceae bacterium]|nr:hypothetical protein [Flavobacteriaceae bacterium]